MLLRRVVADGLVPAIAVVGRPRTVDALEYLDVVGEHVVGRDTDERTVGEAGVDGAVEGVERAGEVLAG